MANKYLLATLQNMTPIPDGSICRGDGVFDFVVDEDPANVKEKLSEYDDQMNLIFKKKGLAIESRAEILLADALVDVKV